MACKLLHVTGCQANQQKATCRCKGLDGNCSCPHMLQVISKVDIILLSHCTLQHVGALPYLLTRHRTQAQIYATTPVYKMGVLVMYDQLHAVRAVREFDVFQLSDVDQAFGQIRQLKYQQFVRLKGKRHVQACEGQ